MSNLGLKALKPMKYMTRRLQPGDAFEAKNRRDHALLVAIKKAEPHSETVQAVEVEEPVEPETAPKPKKPRKKKAAK